MANASLFREQDVYVRPLLRLLSRYVHLSKSDAQQLNDLLSGSEKHFSRGDLLIEAGTQTGQIYVLAEGWAAEEKVMEGGDTCILGFLLPGDTTSINAGLGIASDVSVRCLTEVTVVTVAAPALKAFLASNPNITQAFSLMRLARESMNREKFVSLTAKPAESKLAHLLCELSLRDGQAPPLKGVMPRLRLTQQEIAAALGLSAVHVNRVVQRMRKKDLLIVRPGVIYIKWDILAQLYDFDATYMAQFEGGSGIDKNQDEAEHSEVPV
ncbi:Crp/Fnr family transcriptional regulator [Marinobacter nanhaiticus D15-8W]|uniref:Crp/Fnr family transcriptional regulator n=1 Tax=Marinobacter nanhaiticus D15-8W TaxID=626887 RepID=N6WZA7_9GAMM|nr:Crp/Fnr family transcriptional regulator [Marinobacter nanhaiticus]ENO14098.1 Crp/Fnr family transcriptional regulator [Marinobacter nanhaiticus D15-8W]BES71480.1 Crp/Fnr family transcriptional regulator [Marinobacter nanhaiticus D15-8W]